MKNTSRKIDYKRTSKNWESETVGVRTWGENGLEVYSYGKTIYKREDGDQWGEIRLHMIGHSQTTSTTINTVLIDLLNVKIKGGNLVGNYRRLEYKIAKVPDLDYIGLEIIFDLRVKALEANQAKLDEKANARDKEILLLSAERLLKTLKDYETGKGLGLVYGASVKTMAEAFKEYAGNCYDYDAGQPSKEIWDEAVEKFYSKEVSELANILEGTNYKGNK